MKEQSYQSAYDQAVRWLAQRAYGERELAYRLERSGVPADMRGQVLDRCRELGYLNDQTFANSRARVRLRRGYGPALVRAELHHLGIDDETVEAALEATHEEMDPLLHARQVLEKRFGPVGEEWGSLDVRERRRRYDFLARRGFDADVIHEVLFGTS
ncbi:MAG: recombination regulator RecX [Magnetococcus sp. YQC-5]